MFCPSCGKKVLPSQKFCTNCGENLKAQSKQVDDRYPSNLNLVKGLNPWLNKEINKRPANPYLVLRELIAEYPDRYSADGKLLKVMPEDTKSFIFDQKFTEVINTFINQDVLESMSPEEVKGFNAILPVLNGVRIDTIVIGYFYHILFIVRIPEVKKYIDESGISSSETPGEYIKYLLDQAQRKKEQSDMFADTGFNFPYGPHMILGLTGAGLLPNIESNIRRLSPYTKAFILPGNQNLLALFLVGWCLARYDITRKSN